MAPESRPPPDSVAPHEPGPPGAVPPPDSVPTSAPPAAAGDVPAAGQLPAGGQAPVTGPLPAALLALLRTRPRAFTLFAALRALEAVSPDQPRVGAAPRPTRESVRLAQRPHLEFAPTEIASLEEGHRWKLEQFGFGLFGPNGALPLHLTELILDRAMHFDDTVLCDFINTLQHRWIALFYRAWLGGEPTAQAERPREDEFLACLRALVGLDATDAEDRGVVSDAAKGARAGLFAATRSAEGLEILLANYFKVAVEVRQFYGRWADIPADSRLRLGGTRESADLGRGATLGGTTWQVGHSFEIALGPLDRAGLERFLPGAPALGKLRELVRQYTNDEWQWQLRLLVRRETVAGASLGARARLGETSWLGAMKGVAADVVLQG
jgi:type VI secretion system protein ImpH